MLNIKKRTAIPHMSTKRNFIKAAITYSMSVPKTANR